MHVNGKGIAKEMGGQRENEDKQNESKRSRKKKITWNRRKNDKLKSEVASIQSLRQAYDCVSLMMSDLTYNTCFYLFVVYLTTLLVTQTEYQRYMILNLYQVLKSLT